MLRKLRKENRSSASKDNADGTFYELKRSKRLKEKKEKKQRENEETNSTQDEINAKPQKICPKDKKQIKQKSFEEKPNSHRSNKKKNEANKQEELEGIANTIDEILSKLERKKSKLSPHMLNNKRKRSNSTKKPEIEQTKKTAKDFNFHLEPNTKAEHTKIINLTEAQNITTDILLSMIELAINQGYYQIPYQSRSNAFWEDALLYEEIKVIFKGISAKNLRRYWCSISSFEHEKIASVLNEKKDFFNQPHIKIRTVINGLINFFNNNITDIEEYIKNIHIDVTQLLQKKKPLQEKKKEQEIIKISKQKFMNTSQKKKPIEKKIKPIIQESNSDISIEEEEPQPIPLIKTVKKQNQSNEMSNDNVLKEDKQQIYALVESDKVLINLIDNIATDLTKEFKKYTKDYIIEILTSNSFNVANTYIMLKEFSEKQNITMSSLDEAFIQKVKEKKQAITIQKK